MEAEEKGSCFDTTNGVGVLHLNTESYPVLCYNESNSNSCELLSEIQPRQMTNNRLLSYHYQIDRTPFEAEENSVQNRLFITPGPFSEDWCSWDCLLHRIRLRNFQHTFWKLFRSLDKRWKRMRQWTFSLFRFTSCFLYVAVSFTV